MNQDSPPPKQDFFEKLTDALIKLLVTGSGGSAIYFLYVDELPKAAIAGVISVATGLLTTFGEGLLGVLKEWTNKRGKQVGEGITQAADRTLENLSKPHQHYLEALKASCYAVEIEGFQDLPGLALKDVFVPLRIESARSDWGIQESNQDIWAFLPRRYHTSQNYPSRRIAILGSPGHGKTTLLRHLTFTYANNPPANTPPFIPILLRFREIHPLLQSQQPQNILNKLIPTLPELIVQNLKHQPECEGLKLSSSWFTKQLKQGHCLVMFDGLDEVPISQRQLVRRWVDRQMKIYRTTQFILTSRPHGFELQPDDPTHPLHVDLKLRVLDFTPDQKQNFIEKWYRTIFARLKWKPLLEESYQNPEGKPLSEAMVAIKIQQESQASADELIRQIVNNPGLNGLARNPLLITMIAATHRAETTLPKRRVELYDKICNLLLGTRPHAKKNALTLTATQNKVVLQVLAWQLVQQESTQFSPTQGTEWIQDTLSRCCQDETFNAAKFWQEMTEIAGLLVEKEPGQYEFTHQTFQEYLAALQIKEQGQQARLLKSLNNDRWQEVICFYAALGDATCLIEAILDNPTPYTLQLANRCKNEGREVDPQVRDRLEQRIVGTSSVQRVAAGRHLSSPDFDPDPQLSNLVPQVRLEQRFRQLTAINEQTALDPTCITWGEYQLFLEDQTTGQFHSQVTAVKISPGQANQSVTGISWQDARWFCAWLATQTNLQPEEGTYFYRLPTEAEIQQVASVGNWIPFTDSQQHQGNVLQVVRVQLGDRYKALLNYLANGRWQEANEETYEVMCQVIGKRSWDIEDIQNFPCEDLLTLDQFWIQFSSGRFGLSVQRDIYASPEIGGKLDGKYNQEAWYAFCEKVKWTEGGNYVFNKLTYSLWGVPGHLPCGVPFCGFGWVWVSSLAQSLENCNI